MGNDNGTASVDGCESRYVEIVENGVTRYVEFEDRRQAFIDGYMKRHPQARCQPVSRATVLASESRLDR